MIAQIIQCLKAYSYEESTELMRVAKGKHSMPKNWKEVIQKVKERNNGR